MTISNRDKTRFWAKVDKSGGADACWIWTGARMPKGYGRFCVNQRTGLAHRAAWRIANGDVPDGMHVLHRCDNPPCVNPAHLFLGTHADNMHDMAIKGRAAVVRVSGERHWSKKTPTKIVRGERHGRSKLTEEQVRRVLTSDESGADLGRRFGVSKNTIYKIRRGVNWKGLVA